MSVELARKVADAVLYEGYVLYPYRRSSTKNRFRWQFGIVAPRAWSEAERAARRRSCEDFASTMFRPVDADVAKTPAEAWSRFIAASRAGDIEKAAACFLFTSRARYREAFRQMGPEGLRETAATMGELTVRPDNGGLLAQGDLVRRMPDGRSQSYGVAFARDPRTGGWYIKMM